MNSSSSNVFVGKYNKALYSNIKSGLTNVKDSIQCYMSDFDGCQYFIQKQKNEAPVFISIFLKCWSDLVNWNVVNYIKTVFPTMVCDQPVQGYNLTLCLQNIEENKIDTIAEQVASLRLYCLSAPIIDLFARYNSGSITSALPVYEIMLNPPELLYISGSNRNLNVTFSINTNDDSIIHLIQVFLQEFADTQRTVSSAPLFTFYKEIPEELKGQITDHKPNVGYAMFTLLKQHMNPKSAVTITHGILSFKSYLDFHLTATKTYMHTTMRNKCKQWDEIIKDARFNKDNESK